MSGSNRGYVLVAAIAGLFLVGISGAQELRCQRDYYAQGPYQIETNGERQEPPRFDRGWFPCLIERATAAPEADGASEPQQRDLMAQESMALWTFWMVVFAGATTIITGIGTIFIAKQVKLTREAVGDTSKATKAMERQNALAEIAQQPWLVMDIVEIEYCHIASEGELSIGIKWKVENIGDVPAVSAAWFVEAFVDDTVDQAEIERRRLAVTANALNAVRGNLQIFNLARGQPMEWRAGANISKAQIEAFAARFPSDAYVFPTIVCAVVYKSPASGRWLVSDCSWMIRRTNEAGAILGLKVSDLPYPPQTLGFADSVSFTPRIGEPIEVGATKG